MDVTVTPALGPLQGSVRVPGDKSLSHRAVLFAAMAEGTSRPTGVLDSADVRSTIGAVQALGAQVCVLTETDGGLDLEVQGWGPAGPQAPSDPIDCGNSGTTSRLLMGVLAGWPIEATLTGDASLSRRPMRRIMDPLSSMGARFHSAEGGLLPVTVRGGALTAREYRSPVASAQVKSAVLLAGLRASGTTTVIEPALSRDHTERLLPAFGVPVATGEKDGYPAAALTGPAALRAYDVAVPGDPSSAAFLVAAALLVPESDVTVADVCMNPTRVGFLNVLRRMGADIEVLDAATIGAEPVGSLRARFTPSLHATTITPAEVPALIDEIPVLALVATQAEGTTRFEGVGELRVKETDRLAAVADGLGMLGATVRTGGDWLEITGPTPLMGTQLSSLGDHRLAMSWAVAGLAADGETVIEEFEAVHVSFPGFLDVIAGLRTR